MTEIEEHNLGDEHHSLIFPCDCYDHHYLILEWEDEDPNWRYLNITREWRPVRWRDRIRDCFKILRNQEYMQDGVILNDKSIENLKKFLNNHGE